MGSFNFSKADLLLYSPPDAASKDCVSIMFFCLLSGEQWGYDKSLKVYIRFAAPELGTFNTCHGPMYLLQRYVNFICSYVY